MRRPGLPSSACDGGAGRWNSVGSAGSGRHEAGKTDPARLACDGDAGRRSSVGSAGDRRRGTTESCPQRRQRWAARDVRVLDRSAGVHGVGGTGTTELGSWQQRARWLGRGDDNPARSTGDGISAPARASSPRSVPREPGLLLDPRRVRGSGQGERGASVGFAVHPAAGWRAPGNRAGPWAAKRVPEQESSGTLLCRTVQSNLGLNPDPDQPQPGCWATSGPSLSASRSRTWTSRRTGPTPAVAGRPSW
ncbi:hypothetical protein SAMN05421854_1385 [Amycolatopsis rubida]|uniref:Uncharacterized protein n=1 Tax=Amycolatopsis rubida TaxID=112413 RepID=A0A1I6BMZ8_9PSEU|nr:hypothetical protein SAMN05421854_1385 [Amycolatopsis rubida]